MCSEEEFEQWKNGELLFDEWGSRSFVKANSLSDDDKKYAAQDYENHKDEFSKDWSDLSESAKEKYYTKYAKENNIVDDDAKTYEEWQNDDLETFVYRYTSKSGDKIVSFGKYGYDG
jgi:hypothetical protein